MASEVTKPDVPIVGTVTIHHPIFVEGAIIEIPGLGGIPNGGSKEINLVQATLYEQATGNKWPTKGGKPQNLVINIPTEEEVRAEALRKAEEAK
jgi:hypothetical protein